MKKSLIVLWLLLQLFVGKALSQEAYKGQVFVTDKHLSVSGGKLHVDLSVNYEGLKLPSDESLTLTPLLKGADHSLELPAIQVNGIQKQKAYHRSETLNKKHRSINAPAVVVKNDEKSSRQFSYKISVPYSEWMKEAVLLMRSRECGCNGKPAAVFEDKIADGITLPKTRTSTVKDDIDSRYLTLVNIVTPASDIDTLSTLKGSIPFDDSKNLDRLSTDKQNYEIYYRLRDAVRSLQQQNGTSVTRLRLIGYGSPMGNLHKNEKDVSMRALSLKNYLRENRVAGKTPLEVTWVAEDWDSIRSLVQSSDMSLREAVADIINTVDITKGRERMLQELGDGIPYKYLLNHIFPRVKRLEYAISYTHQGLDATQSRRLFETGSRSLKLSEFFAVALSYPKGSTEYNDALDLAARLFPDNPEAAINAASVALTKKDTKRARTYL